MKVKETRDHFVARAYLRRFLAEKDKILVYKRDEERFIFLKPETICNERGWDLIKTATNPLWLKKILEVVEPRLNSSIDSIIQDVYTLDDRFILSLYFSIIHTLNPEQLCMYVEYLQNIIKNMTIFKFNDEYNEKFKDLLSQGHTLEKILKVNIDGDIVKQSIASLVKNIAHHIYTAPWIIIKNKSDISFLTSDNPCHVLPLPPLYDAYPKIVTLDSEHVLLILSHLNKIKQRDEQTFTTKNFEHIDFTSDNIGEISYITSNEAEILMLNKYLIGNANRFVILGKNYEKLKNVIKLFKDVKNSSKMSDFPNPEGIFFVTTLSSSINIEEQKYDWDTLFNLLKRSK